MAITFHLVSSPEEEPNDSHWFGLTPELAEAKVAIGVVGLMATCMNHFSMVGLVSWLAMA